MKIVKKVWNTDLYDDYGNVGNAMILGNGVAKGWHVTSKPAELMHFIESGTDLKKDRYDDLGPGLYFSATPHVWINRDTSKWKFLERLTTTQLRDLTDKLSDEVEKRLDDRYIAKHEADSALQLIELTAKGKYLPTILSEISGQPLNIKFWEPEFLVKLDIEPSSKAGLIEIVAKGFFAELTNNPFMEEWEELMQKYDGAFVRSGFSTTGQTVVYNRDAIVSFGEADPREYGLNPRKRKR